MTKIKITQDIRKKCNKCGSGELRYDYFKQTWQCSKCRKNIQFNKTLKDY